MTTTPTLHASIGAKRNQFSRRRFAASKARVLVRAAAIGLRSPQLPPVASITGRVLPAGAFGKAA